MTRDTYALAALVGLALICATILIAVGREVPDVLAYPLSALVGALVGASVPGRKRGEL